MSVDIPGFADPVGEAQAIFRAVLDALSRPGRLGSAGAGLAPPAPLDPATAAVALALVDQETPLFLDAAMQAAGPWLAFHAGAPVVAERARAAFVLASSWVDFPGLMAGTDEAPEASATVILQVSALGSGTAYRLAGPGLAAPAVLRVAGLGENFVAAWAANHALFPRGVDLVLCAGTTLAALPRSVNVEAV
jgi:alpha-D-ribose 1-methylphosphonate 5-triphosphate synthase subunit PhnH